MDTKTTPVGLTSRGKAKFFPCPVVWTVEEAEGRIRTRFDLSGGGIECNNVPMWSTDVIGKAEGVLTFVGGQDLPQRQPVQPPPGRLSMLPGLIRWIESIKFRLACINCQDYLIL
jgi:hypothetical protein